MPERQNWIHAKNIDGQLCVSLSLRESRVSLLDGWPKGTRLYVVDPPKVSTEWLYEHKFLKQEELVLLHGRNLRECGPPNGVQIELDTNLDGCVGMGEESYPLHLRHDRSTLERMLSCTNAALVLARDGRGKPVGKVIGVRDGELVKVRALGVRAEWRGNGLGRALVSRLASVFETGATLQALSLRATASFYTQMGFTVIRHVGHWLCTVEDSH